MRILDLYRDYRISYATEGHKHCRSGWVNTSCPFCVGKAGLHLGARLDGVMFSCWRCGGKHPVKAVAKLIGVTETEARKIMRQYGGSSRTKDTRTKIRKKRHLLPSGVIELKKRHRLYLENRGFDPEQLIKVWKLKGTGPASYLDGINYSHRILAPFYWDGKQVTFQARDITNRHKLKYLACPEERELIHHKSIIYGRQDKWKDIGICVEGITDVWNIGVHSFGTLGIKYTKTQVRIISRQFKRVIILFDPEAQAQKQAKLLQAELALRGVEGVIESIPGGDPGELDESIVKNFLKKVFPSG